MQRTTTAPPIRVAFDDTVIRAAALVAGRHEIRPPGEDHHLPVTRTDHTLSGFLIVAGGREFVTTPVTPWPTCEVQA